MIWSRPRLRGSQPAEAAGRLGACE